MVDPEVIAGELLADKLTQVVGDLGLGAAPPEFIALGNISQEQVLLLPSAVH